MITILGLGPGPRGSLTLAAVQALASGRSIYLRTCRHPTVATFSTTTPWVAFDDLYESLPTFDAVYTRIVETIIEADRAGEDPLYAVPGDPSLGEMSVRLLQERARRDGRQVEILPGVSFLSPALSTAVGSAEGSLQIIDALDSVELNPLVPVLIYQIHSREVAAATKLDLLRLYAPEHPVRVVRGDAESTNATVADFDRVAEFNHLTSVYVPAASAEDAVGSPHSLRAIVHRLRAPGGCPWDREQTPRSLTTFVLEEAYEVVEAIEDGDPHAIREELGDLLLQVYLQSEIAEEQGDFGLNDVIQGLVQKLIRRHPHVFADLAVSGTSEVEQNWQRLKEQEKGKPLSALDAVSRSLPALAQAKEIQRRLVKAGFNWRDPDRAREKLQEELMELADSGGGAAMASEVGDVLFMLTRVYADQGVDAEQALRGTISRVKQRFAHVEQAAAGRGLSVAEMDEATLGALWAEAKGAERGRGARI